MYILLFNQHCKEVMFLWFKSYSYCLLSNVLKIVLCKVFFLRKRFECIVVWCLGWNSNLFEENLFCPITSRITIASVYETFFMYLALVWAFPWIKVLLSIESPMNTILLLLILQMKKHKHTLHRYLIQSCRQEGILLVCELR